MHALPKVEILFLRKEEVESLLNLEDAVLAAEQAFMVLGEGQLVQDHSILPIKGPNIIATLPTFLRSLNLYGVKQVSVYEKREPDDKLPSVWGSLIILNQPSNGLPYAIMDGTAITNMRSGGGHAVVAAKYLARRDSKTLGVIGCGAQGHIGLRSFAKAFSLEYIKIYDVNPEAQSTLLEKLREEITAKITAVNSAEEAVRDSELILVATTSREPVVFEPWVGKGSFTAGLMGFRDIDPKLGARAEKLVLGSHETDGPVVVDGAGGLPTPMGVSKEDVYADMGEIVTGVKAGRENGQERIIYTHIGMGAHDVILAHKAYIKAKKEGTGTKIYL